MQKDIFGFDGVCRKNISDCLVTKGLAAVFFEY